MVSTAFCTPPWPSVSPLSRMLPLPCLCTALCAQRRQCSRALGGRSAAQTAVSACTYVRQCTDQDPASCCSHYRQTPGSWIACRAQTEPQALKRLLYPGRGVLEQRRTWPLHLTMRLPVRWRRPPQQLPQACSTRLVRAPARCLVRRGLPCRPVHLGTAGQVLPEACLSMCGTRHSASDAAHTPQGVPGSGRHGQAGGGGAAARAALPAVSCVMHISMLGC